MSSSTMVIYMVQSQLGIQFVHVEYGDIKRVIELYHKYNGIICVDLKWYASFLVSNADTPSILAFCVYGTAELKRSIRWKCDLKPSDFNVLHETLVEKENYIPTSSCISCIAIFLTFWKTLLRSVMSKVNDSTEIGGS